MTIRQVLTFVWKRVPDVWIRVLRISARRQNRMAAWERAAFERRAKAWLLWWRCSTVASVALALTASPAGVSIFNWGPIYFCGVGCLVVGSTAVLQGRWSLKDWVTPCRTASGGTTFIALPFIMPAIAYRLPTNFFTHFFRGQDPSAENYVNGIESIAFILLNFLLCLVAWLLGRKPTSRPVS